MLGPSAPGTGKEGAVDVCRPQSPAAVLGQDLTEAAGPVRHGAVADLATVTGSWVTVTQKRREGDTLG